MIKLLEDVPPGVLGFEASGTVHADDYRQVVVPALERVRESGEIRFLVVIPDFKGMSGGAALEDLKVALHYFGSWKRLALVTDIEWMSHVMSLLGWITPGEARVFEMSNRDEAVAWVAA
jgi:hypothetical protein